MQPCQTRQSTNIGGLSFFFVAYDITSLDAMGYPVCSMENRQKVFFYGNSLVLSGLQASLETNPGLELICLENPATERELLELDPSIVIFDLGAVKSEFFLAQMQALPESLLIGVDPETHEILLTGQAAGSITLDQITQFVRSWIDASAGHSLRPPTTAA